MTAKKIIFYTLIFLSAIVTAFMLFILVDNKEMNRKENAGEKKLGENYGELTLKETIALGLTTAKKWDENAMFHRLTSSDESKGGSRGDTGKRYDWNLFFIVPGTDKHLLIGISRGEIDLEREVIGPKDALPIELEDIQLDSPELLKIVKTKYDIYKGEDWATGYHFTLDNIGGKPIVTVVGIDKDKLFTKVNIDPKSGKITEAIHKVPKGGELISVVLETNSPKILKTRTDVQGISSNGKNLVVWGDRKPTGYFTANQPFIELSSDKGESWNSLNIQGNVLEAWFNSNNELYVASELELVRVSDAENKMKSILKLNTKFEKIDYSTNNIAILSNRNIYTTNNKGEKWNEIREPESVNFLQTSKNGHLIVSTQDGRVLLNNGENWDTLRMPINDQELIDLKVIENCLFLLIGNELWVYNLESKMFDKLPVNNIEKILKNGSSLYGISDEGTIYLIYRGDSIEFKADRLFSVGEKIVADVEIAQEVLFIATRPDFIWEEIK